MRWQWLLIALNGYFFIDAQQQVSLLIVDTQGKDPYYYRNLITFAQKAGFSVDYKNMYDLLENSDINHYQALFFMVSPAMLTLNVWQRFCTRLYCLFPSCPTHTIPQHCLNVLRTFAQQSGKAIGIILPGGMKYSEKLCNDTLKTIYSIGQFHRLPATTQSFLTTLITHLIENESHIGSLFGTSLINQNQNLTTYAPPTSADNAHSTPLEIARYHPLIQKALPTGILIHDPTHHITYLVSILSAFNFADINEHFFRNPLNFSYRNELLHAAQETLQAFHDTYVEHKIPLSIAKIPLPSFCSLTALQRTKENMVIQQKKIINPQLYGWIFNKPIACAWLDPYDFFAHEDGEKQLITLVQEKKIKPMSNAEIKHAVEKLALHRGVRIIYEAHFKLLWFECIPEWYLSPQGIRREQRDEYISRMKRIGIALKTFFQKHHTPLPKIFIGLNLTSNFKSNWVANPVKSISSTVYTKIPSPFDIDHFWKPEVLDIFTTFVTLMKESLPIDGIFFDFEMYHAPQQTGSYTDYMDFSDRAWKTYCAATHNIRASHLTSVKDRLDYLQRNKKFKNYFALLEHASRILGQTLKKQLRSIIPHLLFAAYAPTLPSCWFYRGIMAGLSSPTEPLLLATFNTDYQSHRGWLGKHNIHLLHGTAIMLSKLGTAEDGNIIKTPLTHHDFLWYNRPSRMIYHYDQEALNKVWWGIEATPASTIDVMHVIRNSHTHNQYYLSQKNI